MHRVLTTTVATLLLAGACAAQVPEASSSGLPSNRDDATTTTTPATTTTMAVSATTTTAPSPVLVSDRSPLFETPPEADDPATVMVLGDSVTFELAPAILAAADAMGPVEAFNRTQIGLGLSRHATFPFWDIWSPFVDELDPDIVVMQVGIWDVQPVLIIDNPDWNPRDPRPDDPDWDAEYGALMDRAVDTMTARGAHVYWLEMLPSPDSAVSDQMNRAVRDLAERDDRVSMISMTEAFTADGDYITEIDTIVGPMPIRKVDDVHVCRTGAMLAGQVVAEALSHDLGLDQATGWELGEWRFDPRYDVDPCPDAA